jgi:hypothetical protein
MRDLLPIRSIHFAAADSMLMATGLIGFVSLSYGELDLEGIAVRRTRDGRHVQSFPEHRRGRGRVLQPVRPSCQDAREQIEEAVFIELRAMRVIP